MGFGRRHSAASSRPGSPAQAALLAYDADADADDGDASELEHVPRREGKGLRHGSARDGVQGGSVQCVSSRRPQREATFLWPATPGEAFATARSRRALQELTRRVPPPLSLIFFPAQYS